MSTEYDWQRAADGDWWTRSTYGFETGLAINSSDQGSATVLAGLAFSGAAADDIRSSWTKLSVVVPAIRMMLRSIPTEPANTYKLAYKELSQPETALETWTAETFEVLSPGLSPAEVRRYAMANLRPVYPTTCPGQCNVMRLIFSPPTHHGAEAYLVMLGNHVVVDARALWELLNTLLDIASGAMKVDIAAFAWGKADIARLPVPFQYKIGLRKSGDTLGLDVQALLGKFMEDESKLAPFCQVPSLPQRSSGPLRDAEIKINQDDYKVIRNIARSNGATFTSWFCTVMALVALKLNRVEGARSLQLPYIPVDGRWRLPGETYYTCAITLGTLYLKDLELLHRTLEALERHDNSSTTLNQFWEVSRALRGDLQAMKLDDNTLSIDNEKNIVLAPLLQHEFDKVLLATPLISSFGRADNYLKHVYPGHGSKGHTITVGELATYGVISSAKTPVVSPFEWKGRLQIMLQMSAQWHDEEMATTFARTVEVLIAKLAESCKVAD